ncbi:hypothetical protein VOLCADRAFT_107882 [Volvox carteri f. nagariensis]|uniref:Uncharacterized protein n=1 Tax=Volvox carteri f. nagariensis TaxID=3068 RepID=D8UH11_VOLCA|nr:uncharacterized protein VOLCADRAFT_107882 [Volvox carteri f. nagariensis]EFJ40991.1 hypothetical protein VOLCADRAFT_107882 [Volvox carteri f. nagariensis]|eukprot:XP_002957965.1 hypothetical protein VOLCADRAFT_107882 [Volvox carteri f. nagariensis]
MAAIDVTLEEIVDDGDARDQRTRSPNDAPEMAALTRCLHEALDGDDERVDAVRQFEKDLGVHSVVAAWNLFRGVWFHGQNTMGNFVGHAPPNGELDGLRHRTHVEHTFFSTDICIFICFYCSSW